MLVRLTYEGVTYEIDPDHVWVPESRLIKAHTGLNVFEWRRALGVYDGDAVWALWALAKARAGQPVENWEKESESFDLLALLMEFDDDDAESEDPTIPGDTPGPTDPTPTGSSDATG